MCFFIGALALLGLGKLVHHRRHCHRHHCRHGRGRHGRWRGRRRSWRGPGGGVFLSQELDLSREQEDLIGAELDGLRAKVESLDKILARTRADVADIMRSPQLDEDHLAEMFVRQDDALRDLQQDTAARIGRIHTALDSPQRQALADLLERGLGRGLGGPFRGEL